MNFIELGLQVKSYRKWMNHLLSTIEQSINQLGNVEIEYLDNNTYTFTSKVVPTIKQILEDLDSRIQELAKNVPSLNMHPDPNFQDTANWQLIGTGTLTISPIDTTDVSDLSTLTGIDFAQLQGLSNKLVLSGLPNSTDPTASKVGYISPNPYVTKMLNIGGFCKINGGSWQYVTIDLIPAVFSDGYIYQLNVGNFTDFELFYPHITFKGPYYGG